MSVNLRAVRNPCRLIIGANAPHADQKYGLWRNQGGADVVALEDYGIEEGNAAGLVVLETETPAEAVVARPVCKLVLKRGRPVAHDERALFEID